MCVWYLYNVIGLNSFWQKMFIFLLNVHNEIEAICEVVSSFRAEVLKLFFMKRRKMNLGGGPGA